MLKNILLACAAAAMGLALCGCAEVNQAAYGAGAVGGQVMTTPRAVSQGATDAYVGGTQPAQSNPYQR